MPCTRKQCLRQVYGRQSCMPSKSQEGLFTVGCMDNIDHNPSSRTAQYSFHGTAISLIQFPTTECPGTNQGIAYINPEDPSFRGISKLPPTYTTVSAIALPCSNVKVPPQNGSLSPSTDISIQSITRKWDWLKHADQLNRVATMGATDCMSWAAFQATQQSPQDRHLANISLLPLFNENAHSPAMVFHAMKVTEQAVTFLNPGQTPVMAMDQPLFAQAKQLQWKYPDDVGEDKYVIMMGGLHQEMGMYRIIGQYLSGSGWTSALVKSGITTSGRADETEKGVNVTKARYAHEVIATALFLLQKESYDEYVLSIRPPDEPLSFQEWFKKESKDHPQFLYWSIALELELKVLQFVRSIREGDFVLYRNILAELCPWFFVFDYTNYSRWLPVHLRNMMLLESMYQHIYQQFLNSHFVVRKTHRLFSSIALDQAHEQENEKIKEDGGAVGLTESVQALKRWMISGPEISRLVGEFEQSDVKEHDTRHHEQYPAVQLAFKRGVKNMCTALRDMGNPFRDESDQW